MAGVEILEGFLCPICVQDLGSVTNLQDHFEIAHSGDEDRALLYQLKGLFGKAKRKLLGKESDVGAELGGVDSLSLGDHAAVSSSIAGGIDPTLWEPQDIEQNSESGSQVFTSECVNFCMKEFLQSITYAKTVEGRWCKKPAPLLPRMCELPTLGPPVIANRSRPGVSRSLMGYFKSVRGSRIDRYVIETNKLLIRLDKLVNIDVPMDPHKRKAFEKTIVSWAPDGDVSLCTTCGRSFTLTRRRHHCRLCGRILCNKCSHFMPFDFANGDMHIRTCNDCRQLLERREEQMSRRVIRPVIVLLYERTHDCMTEAGTVLSEYVEMANSLNSGDTSFNLEDAQQLRLRLTKLYENIATLSKRISVLGLDNPEPPTPKALRLQQMIAARASAFIQENLLGLPSLPTEADLVRLTEAKRADAQRRIAEERRLERDQKRRREETLENHLLKDSIDVQSSKSSGSGTSAKTGVRFNSAADGEVKLLTNSGWKPAEVIALAGRYGSGEDPMIQQMNIIRGYLKQAQEVRRWDEVQMLEENLRELQREYWAHHNSSQQ